MKHYYYYIQDTRPNATVGNCASFWRPDGGGYTCDLTKAGVYSQEEAEALHRARSTDVPRRVDLMQRVARMHVDVQDLLG
jgi:hypothetical protein